MQLIVLKLIIHVHILLQKNVLTNRDVYNCTDECIHSKQLSGCMILLEELIIRIKQLFVMNVMNILKVLNLLYCEDIKYTVFI